jgi:transcriptional regulator with XRE-family HTH domain
MTTDANVYGDLTVEDIISLRKSLGFTQAGFAQELGLGSRAWSAVETGEATLRRIHIHAVERVALHYASLTNPMLASAAVRRDALELARKLEGRD